MTPKEAIELFRQIESQEVCLTALENKEDVNIEVFGASTGYLIGIFNDAGAFKYVDWLQAPDGERVSPYDEIDAGRGIVDGVHWMEFLNVDKPDDWSLYHLWNWDWTLECDAKRCGAKGRVVIDGERG